MISPLAHVDPAAKIGNNVTIHPFAFIDADVVIGDNCEIHPYVSIVRGTRLGKNNRIYQNSVIGADPQDFRWKNQPSFCTIGDNNVIRENVIINRGFNSEEGTIVGNDCFIMAMTHIGHDSVIEGQCVLGNNVVIAGDTRVGQCCILSSAVMLHENSRIGDWVLVKGGCRISGNVPPYIIMAHNPASYFGVNAFVLRKKGHTEEQIDEIAKAYRHVYQCGTSVFNAMKRIEADIEPSPIRDSILGFIRESRMKLVGIPRDLE